MTVVINSPASGTTLQGTVTVTATYTGTGFNIATATCDGVQFASDSSQPLSFAFDTKKVADGTHTLTVAVKYKKGGTYRWDKASMPITVKNAVPVTPTWTSSISDGQSVVAGTTWSATVSPTPDSVEFWYTLNGVHTLYKTDTSAPYDVVLNLAPGSYLLGVCVWYGSVRTCFDDRKNITIVSSPPSNIARSNPTAVVTS